MIPCVALISWALLSIEEVGNTIEDPFNMPFLFEGGQRDELQLERSFQNIRGDILDRSPACIPPAMSQERATGGGEGEQDQQVPQALLQTLLAVPAFMQYENQTPLLLSLFTPLTSPHSLDQMCFAEYDVTLFHRDAVPTHRLSLMSPAALASVEQQLFTPNLEEWIEGS